MNSTFPVVLPGCDITFHVSNLSFNQQERAIILLAGIETSESQTQRFAVVRELMSIAVAGWDRPESIESWGDKIDMANALQLIEACVKGNATSEDERKK
jgi:hypothetical protein